MLPKKYWMFQIHSLVHDDFVLYNRSYMRNFALDCFHKSKCLKLEWNKRLDFLLSIDGCFYNGFILSNSFVNGRIFKNRTFSSWKTRKNLLGCRWSHQSKNRRIIKPRLKWGGVTYLLRIIHSKALWWRSLKILGR